MAKVTLPRLTSLTNQESAVQALNAWAEALEEFSDKVLSRNGQTPNTMSANLDMNSYKILNIPAPVDDTDLVRLGDIDDGVRGPKGDPGAAGGPLADGDYGDVVVSGTGTVFTLDSSIVTTVAKTLLDDTTTAAMRTTLGLGDSATLNVGTGASTVAAGNDSGFTRYTLVTQNTSFSLPLITRPTAYLHTSATPHTFTVDAFATTGYPSGSQYIIYNNPGAGNLTLDKSVGVSLLINGGTVSATGTISPGGAVTLINVGSDQWIAAGPGLA